MRTKWLLVVLLVAAPISTASAQVSVWLQRGTSGFGGALSLSSSDEGSAIGVLGGYSYQGFLDIDLAITRYAYDSDVFLGADVSAIDVAPAVEYHPLKQGPGMPVSIGIGGSYHQFFYSSEDFDDAGLEFSSWAITASATAYRFFRLGERTGVIPAAGILYGHTEGTVTLDGTETTESDDNVALGLSGYFAYLSGTTIFGIVPFVIIGDNTTFGVNLGIIFSQPSGD